jgi:hypothetical protein
VTLNINDLVHSPDASSWQSLLKDGKEIGRVQVESNFIESSSSEERHTLRKIDDLNLIDDDKLLSKPYWIY